MKEELVKLFTQHEVDAPCVIFVATRALAEEVGTWLGSGWTWVHGGMCPADRASIATAMRDGLLTGVVCTDVWATGVDIPNIRSVVMACGGSAPIGLKQRAGRGTRLFGAKEEFTIYDLNIGGSTRGQHRMKRTEAYKDVGFKMDGDLDALFTRGSLGAIGSRQRDITARIPRHTGEAATPSATHQLEEFGLLLLGWVVLPTAAVALVATVVTLLGM